MLYSTKGGCCMAQNRKRVLSSANRGKGFRVICNGKRNEKPSNIFTLFSTMTEKNVVEGDSINQSHLFVTGNQSTITVKCFFNLCIKEFIFCWKSMQVWRSSHSLSLFVVSNHISTCTVLFCASLCYSVTLKDKYADTAMHYG